MTFFCIDFAIDDKKLLWMCGNGDWYLYFMYPTSCAAFYFCSYPPAPGERKYCFILHIKSQIPKFQSIKLEICTFLKCKYNVWNWYADTDYQIITDTDYTNTIMVNINTD